MKNKMKSDVIIIA